MATKPSLKITDLFNAFSNPSGGFKVANSTPSMIAPKTKKPSLAELMANVKSGPQSTPPGAPLGFDFLGRPVGMTPAAKPTTPPAAAPAPASAPRPIFPAATGAPTAPAAPAVPPQWLNPDGSFRSPDEVASTIASSLKASNEGGDVGKIALTEFGPARSAAELGADARAINNTRNDLAVGQADPFKVASKSGIAYTPEQMAAIEKAYAGVYDPQLNTVLAALETQQQADADERRLRLQAELEAKAPYTLGKDQVRYDGQGNIIASGISSSDGLGTGTYTPGADPTVDAFVKGIRNGTYKASDIPDEYKALVAQGMSATQPKISKASTEAVSVINQILDSDILAQISGVPNVSTFLPGTEAQQLLNLSKQLKGMLSLENREQLAGSGAISDFEFRVLGDAASALGIGEGGRTNLSEDDFIYELEKLQLKLQVGETELTDDELLYLRDSGYSPEEIRQYSEQQSFGSVGNTTASATGTGNVPQRNNNPGNVKSGGLADSLAVGTDDQGHLIFPNANTGFRALMMDLTAKVNGASRHLPANPTIAQLGSVYAEDPNWPKSVARILGVSPSTPTQSIPIDQLAQAIATQEGFYA